MEYPISFEGETVGTAKTERQGLYYAVSCRCDLPEKGRYKIYARTDDTQVDLGICVPKQNMFGMDTKISVKKVGTGEISFRLEPVQRKSNTQLIPVSADEPFPFLSKLESCYFLRKEGICGLVMQDRS